MYTTKPMNRKPVILTSSLNHIIVDMPSAAWLIHKHRHTYKPFYNILGVALTIVILYFLIFTILIAW